MKNYLLFLISFLAVLVAKCIPLSFIVGSQVAFFSGITSAAILMTRYLGFGTLFLCLFPLKSLSIEQLFLFLVNRSPLLFAGWSYRFSNIFTSVILPLSCFGLFIIHPIGQHAWPYALYWLIPVTIFTLKNKNIFLKSLEAVFVAHAVGSVIWIYTHQMEPEVWLSLIPVVALERILMAFGIVAGEYSIEVLRSFKNKAKLFCNRKFA